MIRIRAELLPGGDETNARSLGSIEIANVGGTQTSGDYAIRILRAGARRALWKLGQVHGFPRRELGVWDLLLRTLADVLNANETSSRRSVEVPASWQKSISEADLESAEAEKMIGRHDEIAEAIRAWIRVPADDRARAIASMKACGFYPSIVPSIVRACEQGIVLLKLFGDMKEDT